MHDDSLNFNMTIKIANGFYLNHSGLWSIEQYWISYFSSANLKKCEITLLHQKKICTVQ